MELRGKETVEQVPDKKSERVEFPAGLFSPKKGTPETVLQPSRIEYIGNRENVDPIDIKKAQEMLIRSHDFIVKNAETPVERKVAETLDSLFRSNKIKLCDSEELCGKDAYGVFCSGKDPYIAIDLNCALDYGMAELVDTLSHEGYHAAQYKAGNKNDIVKEEVHAWNFGLSMSNGYRIQHGESIARTNPYTEREMRNQGYSNFGSGKGFAEIC